MNIGDAAKAAGLSAKMIRHYERLNLLPPAGRSFSGYRQYAEREVRMLRFIRRARDLGFSLEEIRNLIGLWQDQARPSREVKALAQAHLHQVERKLNELLTVKEALQHLVTCCHGDERPDCPILEDLAGEMAAEPSPSVARRRGRPRTV